MWNNDLSVQVFQNNNWCCPKSDRWFFFLTLTVWRHLNGKDFKWKKYRGMGLFSEKMEALHAELNERVEAASSSYSPVANFLYYIYLVHVTNNH